MAELTYYVASTLDGFIAHADGSFDGFEWDDEVVADFLSDIDQFETVLMGRKTYEVGLNAGKTSPYPNLRQIVFSSKMESSPDPAVELVSSDPPPFVEALKSTESGPIWLCGGAQLAAALLEHNLIDRVIVKLNPVVFGAGIPLFGPHISQTALEFVKSKTYGCGIMLIEYRVTKA